VAAGVTLDAHGVSLALPAGWDGRIGRRPGGYAVAHAASFPLPAEDGDFATAAAARLPAGGVVVVLVEYEPALAGIGLFAPVGPPARLAARDFSAATLLRRLPGQAGLQRFFSHAGRAFCLYVVVGSPAPDPALAARASDVLAGLGLASG
jgi:hypothetical protein